MYGSYDPVETPKPLCLGKWGSPGAELSIRGPLFSFAVKQLETDTRVAYTRCVHALRHGPPELYSAIQRYTLYSYAAKVCTERYTL